MKTGATFSPCARSLEDRFWSKVDRDGPAHPYRPELGRCALWTAGLVGGYGIFRLAGKARKAHRVAFFLAHGRWPEPCALHSCDNPPCVNIAHLAEGSRLDNAIDRDSRCRRDAPRGERQARSKLTEAEVLQIIGLRDLSQREIARRFGINQQVVWSILNGKTWRHITGATVCAG